MLILNKEGKEIKVGDWLSVKDYKGRIHRYEVVEFSIPYVHVFEHHNDSKYFMALPYHSLKLKPPYIGNTTN